jgi:hypothetical protein
MAKRRTATKTSKPKAAAKTKLQAGLSDLDAMTRVRQLMQGSTNVQALEALEELMGQVSSGALGGRRYA